MSNERKDWELENRREANRALVLMEEANEILSDLQGVRCAKSVSNQLCVMIHAIMNNLKERK